MKRWMITSGICWWLAFPVFAEPPSKTPAEPSAMQALRAARNKGKKPDAPSAPHDEATLGHPDDGTKHAALAAMHAAARRAKRDQTRRERHKELRAQLKNRDIPPSVRAELRTHARRISRLQRIRVLAGDDTALIVRIDGLIARENNRHERHLAALIARAAQAPNKSDDDREQDDEVEE